MAIIAAGVTPDILEAAPSVGGFIVDSFSTISFDGPFLNFHPKNSQ